MFTLDGMDLPSRSDVVPKTLEIIHKIRHEIYFEVEKKVNHNPRTVQHIPLLISLHCSGFYLAVCNLPTIPNGNVTGLKLHDDNQDGLISLYNLTCDYGYHLTNSNYEGRCLTPPLFASPPNCEGNIFTSCVYVCVCVCMCVQVYVRTCVSVHV